MIRLHLLVSLAVTGLAYWVLTNNGIGPALSASIAAGVFLLYWIGFAIAITDGDWFG